MVINEFSVETTRRLSVGLLSLAGALLLSSLDIVSGASSSGNMELAASVSGAIQPLVWSAAFAILAFICAELATHKETPETGHPHSKRNYLQTAFAYIAGGGLVWLCWGAFTLIRAVHVA